MEILPDYSYFYDENTPEELNLNNEYGGYHIIDILNSFNASNISFHNDFKIRTLNNLILYILLNSHNITKTIRTENNKTKISPEVLPVKMYYPTRYIIKNKANKHYHIIKKILDLLKVKYLITREDYGGRYKAYVIEIIEDLTI